MFKHKSNIFNLTFNELAANLNKEGLDPINAKKILHEIYGRKSESLDRRTKQFVADCLVQNLPVIKTERKSKDGTIKLLLLLEDLCEVETVLLSFHKKYTLCLSTQVGCAMNCQFCFTGKMGLKRNLNAGEIVGQYMQAFLYLQRNGLSLVKPNIVFMGQGEPLHNVDELLKALSILMDKNGLSLGPRQITLSTVGYLPGLKRLDEFPPINLALSLHSPFEEEREKIIPLNKTSSLNAVLSVIKSRPLLSKQFIIYEYILLRGINHELKHAEALSELLKDQKAIVNLIAFNPFPGSIYERPNDNEIQLFKNQLIERKIRVMQRKTKGIEMLAACGQLNTASTLLTNKKGIDQPFL